MLAAAAIAVVVAVAAALIWWTSDARATDQPAGRRAGAQPDAGPGGAGHAATAVDRRQPRTPPRRSSWAGRSSPATGARSTAATRRPGSPRWSYARDRDLCGVTWVYHYAVAVYPDDRGCGQVSTIDGPHRAPRTRPQRLRRSRVTLSSDGTTVLSAGDTRLELWRSDMVRMLAYGEIDAPGETAAGAALPACRLLSAAASSSAVSVLETCPNQADLRLTLLRPGKEDDEPQQQVVPATRRRRPIPAPACWPCRTPRTAVYLPDTAAAHGSTSIDETGATVVEHAAAQAAVAARRRCRRRATWSPGGPATPSWCSTPAR